MNSEVNALIDDAERQGKWLWTRYHDLWFSPAQLRAAQAHGRFCWGVANWELRDPKEKLAELDEAIVRLQVERQKYI